MTAIEEFARLIETAQRKARTDQASQPYLPTATPASALGYTCERRLVYIRTQPMAAAPPGEELSSIFREGREHEKQIRRELSELGFEVLEGEVPFEDKATDIKGHIDGRLKAPWGARVPVEIKSWGGDGPRSEAEWRDDSGELMHRYYAQMQAYLYLTAQPDGLLLTKNKLTGLWAIAPAHLDFEFVERLLKKAERVRDAVRAGSLPERDPTRANCKGCPWFLACLPGEAPVDPLLIATDEDLIGDLAGREALRQAASDFETLDKRIKERFKLTAGDRFIVGSFLVTKKVARNGAVTVRTEVLDAPSERGTSLASPPAADPSVAPAGTQ